MRETREKMNRMNQGVLSSKQYSVDCTKDWRHTHNSIFFSFTLFTMENSVVNRTNILTRVWTNEEKKLSFGNQNTVCYTHEAEMDKANLNSKPRKKITTTTTTERYEWDEKKPNTERAMADQPKTIAMNLNSIQH